MKKKTKILICIPSFTFGGAEIHSYYTGRALQTDLNNEVYFLAFGKIDNFKKKLEDDGFKTLHFSVNDFMGLSVIDKSLILVRLFLFLKPFQFQYVFSCTEQSNLLMGIVGKLLRVKKYFWQQWSISDQMNVGFLEKLAVRFNPYYIVNSSACSYYIMKRHQIKNSNEIKIIHNTFNEKLLELSHNPQATSFNLVMLANFFPEKDHITVLKAFKLFLNKYPEAEAKLFFAGSAPGKSLALLETKSKAFDLGLCDRVVFVGRVEDVSPLLSSSHVGILSTTSEGLSNALLEYMAVGLPIIATDIPQNREALGEMNMDWLFTIGNEQQCFLLMEKLYLDKELRESLGKQNQKFVQKTFSFEIYKNKILDLVSANA
jgi:glycosyltransferase involved in cell wall biosynthesis